MQIILWTSLSLLQWKKKKKKKKVDFNRFKATFTKSFHNNVTWIFRETDLISASLFSNRIDYYFKNMTGFFTTNLMAQKSEHRLGDQNLNLVVEDKPQPHFFVICFIIYGNIFHCLKKKALWTQSMTAFLYGK